MVGVRDARRLVGRALLVAVAFVPAVANTSIQFLTFNSALKS
jgi:hypothetical protein